MIRNAFSIGAKVFAVGAVLALAGLIAAPANAAGPVVDVVLQHGSPATVHAYGDYAPTTAVNKGPVSATFLGTNYACTGASGSGKFTASSAPTTTAYLTLSSTNIAGCAGPLGLTMTITQNAGCNLTVTANSQTVDTPVTDTNVTGILDVGTAINPCLHATGTNGLITCNLDVYGQTAAAFNETNQRLTLSGSGLAIVNGANACSFISDGTPISLNLVFTIAVTSPDAPPQADVINFRP